MHHQDNDTQPGTNELASKFISSMASELRSPFNALLGFPKILLREEDGPLTEIQKLDLTIIYNSSRKLFKRINQILDIAKFEAGMLSPGFLQADLKRLLDEVINEQIGKTLIEDGWMLYEQADSKFINLTFGEGEVDIKFEKNVPAALPIIWANPTRLAQIIFEVMMSAVEFTNNGGIITLTVSYDHENVRIDIRNTGSGLPESILEELTAVSRYGSLYAAPNCMGLAISRYLVEMHEGVMKIENQEGIGTTTTFHTPIEKNKSFFEVEKEGERIFSVYSRNVGREERIFWSSSPTEQQANAKKRELENTIYPKKKLVS